MIIQYYIIFFFLPHYTFLHSDVSDLQAVVAVVNQEVLLEPQLPSPSCTMDQRHPGRDFLICLVFVVQQGQGAVEGHLHLVFTEERTTYCQE